MDTSKPFSSDLIKLISRWVENKLYGSIEIYFEKGQVTQFTQRIIKKLNDSSDNKGLSSDNRLSSDSALSSDNKKLLSSDNNKLQSRKIDRINIRLGNGHEDNLNQVVD